MTKKTSTYDKRQFRHSLLAGVVIGVLVGFYLTNWLWQKANPPQIKPQVLEVVKEAEAHPRYCGDPISYIRCRGEDLEMPNEDIMKMIRIARCESHFDQYAKNPYSTAKGIFQFIDSTWRSNCLKDGNVYDFVDNINCAWKVYQKQGDRPWKSSIKCWNK